MTIDRPTRLPSLDLLKGFSAVGRHMSVTLAARELHLTQSAVSRQIQTLEEVLNCRLFLRGHRSISFTREGEQLFNKVEPALRQLQDAFVALRPTQRPVTITASIGVTTLWLLPRLGKFTQMHPNIDLRVSALNRITDLPREGIDLAIRYCDASSAPPGATLLFEESIGVVASPALKVKALKSANAIKDSVLLEYEDSTRPWLQWRYWLEECGWGGVRPRGIVRFNQYDQVVLAAMSGQGLALGRLPLLSTQLQSNLLVRIPAPVSDRPLSYGYWLIYGEHMPREVVNITADWLRDEAAR